VPRPAQNEQRRTAILLSSFLIIVLVIGGVVFLVTRGNGNTPVARGPGEIFLQPAAGDGPNPFTSTVARVTTPLPSLTPRVSPTPSESASASPTAAVPTAAPGSTVIQTASGGTPGLYGGSNSLGECDSSLLVRYLQANPTKARAWVAALNSDPTLTWSGGHTVSVDQIPAFVAELTPMVLRSDTRVTNNGFVNGNPDPYQAVLQRGTAVLVDRYGVPRSRCACGNPLDSPKPVPVTPTYTGNPWPTFNPTTIVVVQPAPVIINIFVLTNEATGTTFNRPAGSSGPTDVLPPASASPSASAEPSLTPPPNLNLGTGDIQVTLLWTSDSDLDLHVIDPSGFEIYYANRQSPSGGMLDHDEVPGCGSASSTHVENVFWASGSAPPGQYSAFANIFEPCSATNYELTIKVGGQVISDTTGTLPATSNTHSTPVTFSHQ
jgi:hypothetical protein